MQPKYIYDPELCEVEPIHIIGNIQPHGVLIALDRTSLVIRYVSENVTSLLGTSPAELIHQPIVQVIGEANAERLYEQIADENLTAPVEQLITLSPNRESRQFQMYIHDNGQFIVLEFEPDDGSQSVDFFAMTQDNFVQIHDSANVAQACDAAAQAVRALTGYDRVLVYRFDDDDGHGVVVAESREPDIESFLGHHYPATDIPQPARQLFLLNSLRIIVDARYEPANVLAANADLPPLDMRYALLRGVSPGHLRYLGNMGVQGSMSIAIIKGGMLWGLIACHHRSAHFIPRHVRNLCRFLGMVFSAQIGALQDRDSLAYTQAAMQKVQQLMGTLRDSKDALLRLRQHLPELQSVTQASGAAIFYQDTIIRSEDTPGSDQIEELTWWLHTHHSQELIYETNALSSEYPPARDFADVGSGLLALALSQAYPIYILWFQPEVIRTITWGRQIEQVEDSPPLRPDSSFRQWRQSVEQMAPHWHKGDITAARELRTQLSDLRVYQALAYNAQQMRTILNTLPNIVFVYRNSDILFLNETAPLFTAYNRHELMNEGKLWDVIRLTEALEYAQDGVLRNHEMRIMRKDGTLRWVYINTIPLTFEEQPAMICTVFDITDRREAEQEKLEIEIERQQIRMLAEFIQDASHDLRTPITVLITSLHLIKRYIPQDQQERIELMEMQAHHLTRMIEDLMTMARLDSKVTYKFQPLDLNRILLSIKPSVQTRAEFRHQVMKFSLDPQLPILRADPFELERCFTNLIDNAVKYTPEGGQIYVWTTTTTEYGVVVIQDNGEGIDEQHLPNIFKRFYRANDARTVSGTGLGLSIVKKIVDAHHGQIEVESKPGEGTTFRVLLPLAKTDNGA